MANIKTGITLFSLGTLFVNGDLNFEDCVREAANMGAQDMRSWQPNPFLLIRMCLMIFWHW